MNSFLMNGLLWHVKFVEPWDRELVDRTRKLRVATTNPVNNTVYLSKDLDGVFLMRVFIHELGHCVIVSFNLTDDIHKMVREEYWIEMEEWVCNFIADYAVGLFKIAYDIMGNDVWEFILYNIERMIQNRN